MCGGGPSREQRQAATSQSQLSDTLSGIAKQREGLQFPFIKSRLEGGLPFMSQLTDYSGGTTAKAFQPARAQLARRLSSMGPLPSGFANQANTNLDAMQGRAFDDNMVRNLMLDEETKQRAAGMASPMGYFSGAQQGYGSIMGQPQQPSMLGSILGGALGGLVGLCHVAAELYGGWDDPRTILVRYWLFEKWAKRSLIGKIVTTIYALIGRQVAWLTHRCGPLECALRKLFDRALELAILELGTGTLSGTCVWPDGSAHPTSWDYRHVR